MSIIEDYTKELLAINGRLLKNPAAGFRTRDVHCVDKFGRQVCFSRPSEIEAGLRRLMEVFSEEFKNAADLFSLSRAFARFYYGFIAIHPFPDANRRTAFEFLERRAGDKACDIASIGLLQKVLLEGAVAAEMQKLTILFSQIITPRHSEEGAL